VGAAAIGVAATAAVGFAMGQLGQKIFGGAGVAAGAFGAASGAATGAMIGSVLPGIGTAVGAIVGGLVGMASGFIGVSKETKIARTQIAEFQVGIRATLTDQQRAEAGGEAWAETVIAVRDAYLATGRTAEEADAIVKQMWNDKKPKEAEAAIRKIAEVMDEAAAAALAASAAVEGVNADIVATAEAAQEMERAFEDVRDAIDDIPRNVDVNIRANREEGFENETKGFAGGSGGIRDFGRGTLAVLHGRERVQTEAQMRSEQRGGDMAGQLSRVLDFLEYKMPLALRDAVQGAG